jgi:hypothetical protein
VVEKAYRIDIDGTIAVPCFYHEELQKCIDWYINQGIVMSEEVASLQFHQQLFLLPHVLVTHQAVEGAVETLQALHAEGGMLAYFTVRQNFDPALCELVHGNTRRWLEQQHFPCPINVYFFWGAGEKLFASLQAQEREVFLIDDRPEGLLKAYTEIVHNDPETAQQIRERVTVVAFGRADAAGLDSSGLRVVPLSNWLSFRQLIS